MADVILPIGGGQFFSDAERQRMRNAARSLLQLAEDRSGGNPTLAVFALMHAMGYVIARSTLAGNQPFIDALGASVPAYVNAYRQDGGGTVFGEG